MKFHGNRQTHQDTHAINVVTGVQGFILLRVVIDPTKHKGTSFQPHI